VLPSFQISRDFLHTRGVSFLAVHTFVPSSLRACRIIDWESRDSNPFRAATERLLGVFPPFNSAGFEMREESIAWALPACPTTV